MIGSLFSGLVRRFGLASLSTLALLLFVSGTTGFWLGDMIRGLNLVLMSSTGMVGVLVGWWFGSTRLSRESATGLAALLGFGGIVTYVGRLYDTAALLLWQLLTTTWKWGVPQTWPAASGELLSGTRTVLDRLVRWLLAVVQGEPGFDPIASGVIWSLLVWSVAVWAGWIVRRREAPLVAVLPAGILLASTLFYSGERAFRLLPLLGATLLLLALVGHRSREQRWRRTHVDFSRQIRADIVVAVLPLTVGLLLLSAIVPVFSVRQIVRSAQRIVARPAGVVNPVAESLGVRRSLPADTRFASVRAPGLPQEQLIGAGPELSEQQVLRIGVEGAPATFRPYWRSFTYDHYTGRGWRTENLEMLSYEAGESLLDTLPPGYRLIRQQVEEVEDLGEGLYAAGSLVTVDAEFTVARRSEEDLFGATTEPQRYQVDSAVPTVRPAALRATSSEYPEWVQSRYLALPDDLPARVRERALDLTATEPTPYDRAGAIEAHLRTFEYTLDLPAPPLDRDIADYFLFDLQKGYCDYYATTMIVLARAAGLPARLAVGFVGGEYDEETDTYTVTAAEAHSWPEIYFAGYGWIPFEPTAGRPAIEREIPVEPTVVPEETVPEVTIADDWWRLPVQLLLGTVALLAAAGLLWFVGDVWRLHRYSPEAVVTSLYRRTYGQGRRLLDVTVAGDTPYEFGERMARQLTASAAGSRWSSVLAPTVEEIRALTHLYVRSEYSPYTPDAEDKAQALRIWRRLHVRLWLAWLRDYLLRR